MTNLTVRVHFKKQLQVRSDAVSITTKEKEKERDKSIKIVARLEKKLAREEESLTKLVLEAAASNQVVQDLVAEEDGLPIVNKTRDETTSTSLFKTVEHLLDSRAYTPSASMSASPAASVAHIDEST